MQARMFTIVMKRHYIIGQYRKKVLYQLRIIVKELRQKRMLCCSMIGDKKQPFIIGKYKNPRCFKNVDIKKFNVKYVKNLKTIY